MAKKTVIKIDTDIYKPPSEEDIRQAKRYILKMSDVANAAQSIAGRYITEAAEKLVEIAYRYNIPPYRLSFDSNVNSDMMNEITNVMDELEEIIMQLLEEYALSCTDDAEEQRELLMLLANLGHRDMNMRQTVHAYLWRFLHQVGALSAAFLFASLPLSQAKTRIGTSIRTFVTTQELLATSKYRQLFSTPFIKNGFRPTFPDGTPNIQGIPVDGYNAIMQLYGIAIAQIWEKNQIDQWQNDINIAGYYQLRGSSYPCATCDEAVGFYPINTVHGNTEYLMHPNCKCYRVPVYYNTQGQPTL